MEKIIIDEKTQNQRFDKYLRRYLPNAAGGFLYKMLRQKKIKLNGKKADGSVILKVGDVIEIYFSDETLNKFKTTSHTDDSEKHREINSAAVQSFRKRIVYEDENVLLFNKPAGMLSQKAERGDVSACERLVEYLLADGKIDEDSLRLFRPTAVNRLDRNTSGMLVCAKTLSAAQMLSKMFKDRSIEKRYLALVYGDVAQERSVKSYLKKDEKSNKVDISSNEREGYVKTELCYKPIYHMDQMTLLDVELITGKTHQIRAQLFAEGHAIIGDRKYAPKDDEKVHELKRQFLHAYKLVFPKCKGCLNGVSEKAFEAELPYDLLDVLKANNCEISYVNKGTSNAL